MVAREQASERCLAAWRRRSPPRIMVYVCQPHVLYVRSRPCHRARGEARRHRQGRSTPRTMVNVCQPHVLHVRSRPCHRERGEARRHQQDWRQAHGDPDCPDARVAHSAHLRKLHSTSCHLRLDGRYLTVHIMKRFSQYPRWRLLWASQRNFASWHGLRHSQCSRLL